MRFGPHAEWRRPPTGHKKEDFREFQWKPEVLLQWMSVQGRFQTAARAEDVAFLAGLLGPMPTVIALDNASAVTFVKGLTGGAPDERRPRPANDDVRTASASAAAGRGAHNFLAYKAKAHTTEAQAAAGRITSALLRGRNEVADIAAKSAVLLHPTQLRLFVNVMAGRGKLYIRFLKLLTARFIRVARRMEAAYKRAVGAEDPPSPKFMFGRRRLARAEIITLDLSSRPSSGMASLGDRCRTPPEVEMGRGG